jgi:hypothetical protein
MGMRLTAVLAVLSVSPVLAETPDAGIKHTCKDPNVLYRYTFDRAELAKVARVVTDATCKTIILGPGTEKATVTITTADGSSFTREQFYKAFVAAAEVNGLTVIEKDGLVRVTVK